MVNLDGPSTELPTNIEYLENVDTWTLYRDVYESRPEVLRDPAYLIPHELETKTDGAKKLTIRQHRTFPLNFTEPIVSIWQDLFMKGEPVVEDSVLELFNGHPDDVDGKGNDLISYLETEMLRDRFVFGSPTTLVDAPVNTAANGVQEREMGIRPFLVPIDRLSLVDWSVEKSVSQRSGRYNFLSYQYRAHVPRTDFKQKDEMAWFRRVLFRTSDGERSTVYSQIFAAKSPNTREWSPQGDPEQIEDFSEIPAITMQGSESWIQDVSVQVLKYLNLESTLDNILYYQGYRHTFVSGNVPAKERGKINEYTLVILPEGSSITTIPSENPAALLQRLADTENNIWRFGLQQIRQIPTNSKVGQSADSQRMEREPTLNMVKRNIRQFELFANQIVETVALYHKMAEAPGKVTFSRDITENDIEQTVLVMNTLKSELSRLPTLRRETIRQLVQSLNFRQEVQTEIDKEIDSLSDEDLTDTAFKGSLQAVFGTAQEVERAAARNGTPIIGTDGGQDQAGA